MRLGRHGPRSLEILVDGHPILCYEGETIATAILAQRRYVGSDAQRLHGLWCGIGICFECVVTVDGKPGVRACMTRVRPGIQVSTEIARGGAQAITLQTEPTQ
jgi:predicted molibdopterin-dependent oxidoreductase YjgC